VSDARSRLTFRDLRVANAHRLPLFKNGKGELAHPKPDGSDWSPGEWVCAVTGELGELANIIKKVRRGDVSVDDVRADIADELADVVCYLDILASQFGVDLGRAIVNKFNRVSERVGAPIFFEEWFFDELAPLPEIGVVHRDEQGRRTELYGTPDEIAAARPR